MSFDLYLLPLSPGDDFETAMSVFDALESGEVTPKLAIDVRETAGLLTRLDPRYQQFQKDYAAIARFEKISEAQAKERYDFVELNGTAKNGDPLAQFVFCRDHVVIHWYSGTSSREMIRYIRAICDASGLCGVDPQQEKVLPTPRGWRRWMGRWLS